MAALAGLAGLISVSGFPVASAGEAELAALAAPVEILFHADLDGRLARLPCDDARVSARPAGYAALVGLIERARTEARMTGRNAPLVLLGGNIAAPDLPGAHLLGTTEGASRLSAILARGGYDAIALGHHELSLEPAERDRLLGALAGTRAPVVLSNLRCGSAAQEAVCGRLKPEVTVVRGALTVGVVATLAPAVLSGFSPASRRGLSLDDPFTAARASIGRLRARGAQLVVLITQGPRGDRAVLETDLLARRLGEAPASERPDLILAGGLGGESETDHPLRLLRRQGVPPILGAPAGATGLARVITTPGAPADDPERTVASVETPLLTAPADEPPAPADPATEALLRPEIEAACAAYGGSVAPASVRGILTRDAFTGYVLEVMRRRTGAELAIINRALVKQAPFPITGALTTVQLMRALPYRSVLGTGRMAGSAVEAALGAALNKPEAKIAGLTRAGAGGPLLVNGRAVDRTRSYRVVTVSFVAAGGDGLLPTDALAWAPLPGEPDLRSVVAGFLTHDTAVEDGDPTIDAATDFGRPPSDRPLIVGLTDAGLDVVSTSITNAPVYGDTQLARAQQLAVNADAAGVLTMRHPRHEADGRLALKYGWTRTTPAGGAPTANETADLVTFTASYNYRGLRGARRWPRPAVPDPYLRLWIESELTRPDVTATQPRAFHHLQMTDTVGALFTIVPQLRLRLGAGVQRELLAGGEAGRWRPMLEAGGTLDPVAVATFGPLAVKVEALVDYGFVDPAADRQHQLRATGKLSVPLVPTLYLTVGTTVFAVQRQRRGWAAAADTTIGLRVHFDAAYQKL